MNSVFHISRKRSTTLFENNYTEELNMKSLLSIIIGLASATAVSAQDTASPALNVVPSVDLNRYTGTWYEIARLPNQYQNDCAGDVTATYTLHMTRGAYLSLSAGYQRGAAITPRVEPALTTTAYLILYL